MALTSTNHRQKGFVRSSLVVPATLLLAIAATCAAAPKITETIPHPADWVIGDASLESIDIVFDANVDVPDGAIRVRSARNGWLDVTVSVVETYPTVARVSFKSVQADRVTLFVDFTITDASGMHLDGEVDDPLNPDLESGTGDGIQGGHAVFQYTVLQGDLNQDGAVNVLDTELFASSMGTCVGEVGYVAAYDLNGDSCIDHEDTLIHAQGLGGLLPMTDGFAPEVVDIMAGPLPLSDDQVVVEFAGSLDEDSLISNLVYAYDVTGALTLPSGDPVQLKKNVYAFPFKPFSCLHEYTFVVSDAFCDTEGDLAAEPVEQVAESIDDEAPQITCPQVTYVNSTESWGIPAGGVLSVAVAALVDRVAVVDDCATTFETSLDEPVDLNLGVTLVELTAIDTSGNWASCEAPLVVVQAVETEGTTGPAGPTGPTGPAGADGTCAGTLHRR